MAFFRRRIPGILDTPAATTLEAATVRKLRNTAGWWEGDPNALTVLRDYANKIREEDARAMLPAPQPFWKGSQ